MSGNSLISDITYGQLTEGEIIGKFDKLDVTFWHRVMKNINEIHPVKITEQYIRTGGLNCTSHT
jgi:hypothetical protein